MLRRISLLCALVLPTGFALAGILDDLPELQDKTVVFAGNFERLECSIHGKYDCLSWPTELFKTRGGRELCFTTNSYAEIKPGHHRRPRHVIEPLEPLVAKPTPSLT